MHIDCIYNHFIPEIAIVEFTKRRAGLSLGRFANRTIPRSCASTKSMVHRVAWISPALGQLGKTLIITARHSSTQGAVI